MAAGGSARVPRRLSLVVDRRALVDSQYDYAMDVNRCLHAAEERGDGALGEAARLLRGLRSDWNRDDPPLTVGLARGAAAPSTRWRNDPTACTVICATPDMWGSRLLFRAYGASRHARAREAGLLAYDSVLVVGEAHLARQLVTTARRVEALEAMAAAPIDVPVLQVVESSATVAGADDDGDGAAPFSSVTVEAADLDRSDAGGPGLALRLRSAKPVRIVEDPDWPATGATQARVAKRIAAAAERLRRDHGPTVACVTNTVALALRVATELKDGRHTVEVLVGRMRPYDVRRLRERHPGLLSIDGDPGVDFVVATQTIEVGLDADFRAMVTELAPGSALAQRAGRVNRMGLRPTTAVEVVGPVAGGAIRRDPLPYRAADAEAALVWLRRHAAESDGLAPWSLTIDPPPAEFPRSPFTGRQDRCPAIPLWHRQPAPQHAGWPRPPDGFTGKRDGLHRLWRTKHHDRP